MLMRLTLHHASGGTAEILRQAGGKGKSGLKRQKENPAEAGAELTIPAMGE
jgi:hypothetical protein